jgi:hypothetical protein
MVTDGGRLVDDGGEGALDRRLPKGSAVPIRGNRPASLIGRLLVH